MPNEVIPKDVWLYIALVMFLWFTISATLYVMYKGSKDHRDKDNATACLVLMSITPFVPILLPLAVIICLALALVVLCFWYIPDKIKNVNWLNFRIEDPLISEKVQKRENLPAPLQSTIPYCQKTDLMTPKPADDKKTIKPVEPKIIPKVGDKKPSFKEAFEDSELKNTT